MACFVNVIIQFPFYSGLVNLVIKLTVLFIGMVIEGIVENIKLDFSMELSEATLCSSPGAAPISMELLHVQGRSIVLFYTI